MNKEQYFQTELEGAEILSNLSEVFGPPKLCGELFERKRGEYPTYEAALQAGIMKALELLNKEETIC